MADDSKKQNTDRFATVSEGLSTPGHKISGTVKEPSLAPLAADPLPTISEQSLPPPLPATGTAQRSEEEDAAVTKEQGGHYTVKGVHGRGGQARVLLAFDEHIGRDVAIKELLPEGTPTTWSSTPGSLRSTPGMVRFLREARVTGQLEHPNIVPVHEVGRRADGTLYYTMRFVRGETMSKKLAACRNLTARLKLLGAFWDICNAIAYAHNRGVVHRDIKPENTIIGEFGETVLLDWGIAKVKGQKDIRARDLAKDLELLQEGSSKTSAGTAIGTPSYMSPEQAMGQIDEIDERSDVWGLGAVLYELLTGRPPYVGNTAMSIIVRVGKDPIPPVRQLCREAPPELAAVAEKALQRDKAQRYQSAKELAAEVDAFMTGGRVQAFRYSSWRLIKRFASQHKAAIVAAGLILCTIIGALIAVSLALRNESRALDNESRARQQVETARVQEHQERLVANFHLAQAFAEKANRLEEDSRTLSASVFAAASLQHNPAHPGSQFHDAGFAAKFPQSPDLRVQAASTIYRTRFHALLDLGQVLKGEEVLTRVAYSPDGRLLAVGGFDKLIRIWEVASGTLHQTLKGHQDKVYGLAFSPDGRRLASASRDKTILIWDLKVGKAEQLLAGHQDLVYAVAFSPDGTQLASGSWDKTVRLWDARSGKAMAVLKGHTEKVNGVAFSPDGRLLASAGLDKTVRLWRLPAGKPAGVLAGHADEVVSLAFSPDGRFLASGANDRLIQLWEVASGKPAQGLRGHQDGILDLAFSPDGRLLASASYDKTVRLWDPRAGSPLLTAEGHQDFVFGVAFSPDGRQLASAGYDRTVRLWTVQNRSGLVRLQGHHGTVYGLAFAPGGKILASASWDRSIRLWNLANGSLIRTLKGHGNIVDRVAFSPDGKLLASASRDKTARLWEVDSGRTLAVLRGHTDMVYGVTFSPDGKVLATSGTDKTIRLWDVASGASLMTLTGHQGGIDKVVFSPDGNLLASASYDQTIRLWGGHSGEPLKVLVGHQDWISDVEFSPNGQRLVSSGKDGQALIWDTTGDQPRLALKGHSQWVNSVKFSPDGELLATASDDATIRIWSARDGELKLILKASTGVVGIDFSADGKTLAVGDGNDVLLYPVEFSTLAADPEKLLEECERAAGLNLDGFALAVRP